MAGVLGGEVSPDYLVSLGSVDEILGLEGQVSFEQFLTANPANDRPAGALET